MALRVRLSRDLRWLCGACLANCHSVKKNIKTAVRLVAEAAVAHEQDALATALWVIWLMAARRRLVVAHSLAMNADLVTTAVSNV